MKNVIWVLVTAVLCGCSTIKSAHETIIASESDAFFLPESSEQQQLRSLPEPRGVIAAAVYSFRDQTGQFKPTLNGSSFSTAVTQGSATILTQAMKDSGWFVPLEREGLQNILTERKITRAAQADPNKELPPLRTAQILFEGGIIGYNSNIRTGGVGAAYFGIDAAQQYREDQVTVYLRAIDVRSGSVLVSVNATKSLLSREVTAGFFRFISFRKLAEAEGGFTENEPALVATQKAIEKALSGLIVKGIKERVWSTKNPEDINNTVVQEILSEVASD